MKRKWILQLGIIIMAMLLFIFTINTCSAEKDFYSVVGVGISINETPIVLDVSSPTVVNIDDETDIISVIASSNRIYMYLLTDLISKDSDSAYLGASFAAVDPNGEKYVIMMRMYIDETIQLTICDERALGGFSLFLTVPKEHKGIQTKNDILRQCIIASLQ